MNIESIYNALDLDCNTDSARRNVSNLYGHLRDNPEKYLEYFNIKDIEKFLRKKKLEKIKDV